MNPIKSILMMTPIASARAGILRLDPADLTDFLAEAERQLAAARGPASRETLEDLVATARILLHAANQLREIRIPNDEILELYRKVVAEGAQQKQS